MKFMNDYDIQYARSRFTLSSTPNRLALAIVVDRLAEWTNENSDGWPYWFAALRAASKAMMLIESTTSRADGIQEQVDATDAEVTAAIRPIKAFLTREKAPERSRELILRAVSQ